MLIQASIGWHFEVKPVGIIKISVSFSMSFPCISFVLCAEKASNVSNEFSKPSFSDITMVCFNQISTQTCISRSSIHAFSCIFMRNPSGTRRFWIVFSVVPLKIIIGGSILPSAVVNKTIVTCFFSQPEVRTTHYFASVVQIRRGAKFYISRNRHFCLTLKVTSQIICHWKVLFFLSKNLWVVKTGSWSVILYGPICSTHPLSFFQHFW